MLKKTGKIAWLLGALAVVGGCATVNPEHDYAQVVRHITQATGQKNVYHPKDDELVAGLVEELLQNGISADDAVQIDTSELTIDEVVGAIEQHAAQRGLVRGER